MALKFKLDSLDGLDEAQKAFYKPGPDGKGFVLDLDDDPAKETIAKIRGERDDLAKALKARETAEADAKAAKEREDAEKRGEYEKLRAQDQEEIRKEREAREALEGRLRSGAVERAALEAIGAAKGIPKALLPHVLPALEAIPEGDGFAVRVKSDPGKKPADYVATLKGEMPWGFEGTGASGSGGAPNAGGGNNTKEPPKTAGEAAQQAWADVK